MGPDRLGGEGLIPMPGNAVIAGRPKAARFHADRRQEGSVAAMKSA